MFIFVKRIKIELSQLYFIMRKLIEKLLELWELVRPRGGWRFPAAIVAGAFVGLFIYTFFTSRAYSYLSDNPRTCVNCHIMSPYYATWSHSSHGRNTTCVDCHIAHNNIINHYYVKAVSGLRHVVVFTGRGEVNALETSNLSKKVIMNNCIRCHTQLNQDFVKTGHQDYHTTKANNGHACWDCHREVPHTRGRSEVATPHALVPMPDTTVPDWLNAAMKKKQVK